MLHQLAKSTSKRLLFYCAFGERSAMAVQAAQDAASLRPAISRAASTPGKRQRTADALTEGALGRAYVGVPTLSAAVRCAVRLRRPQALRRKFLGFLVVDGAPNNHILTFFPVHPRGDPALRGKFSELITRNTSSKLRPVVIG